MLKPNLSLLILLILPFCGLFAQKTILNEIPHTFKEVPEYYMEAEQAALIFLVDYAKPIILNPQEWQKMPKNCAPFQVDLVFTKYPINAKDWRTNYDWLLENRIQNLRKLSPMLASPYLRWNIILQTNCKSDESAAQMFHGFVVKYVPLPEPEKPLPPFDEENARYYAYSFKVRTITEEEAEARRKAEPEMILPSHGNLLSADNIISSRNPTTPKDTTSVPKLQSQNLEEEEKEEAKEEEEEKTESLPSPSPPKSVNMEIDTERFLDGGKTGSAKVIGDVQNIEQLTAVVEGKLILRDSSVYDIMARHSEWKNILIVMDWTGSMYKYGAQLLLWHKLNLEANTNKVSHFVFFNDGNNLPDNQKKMGKTGGIYHAESTSIYDVLQAMEMTMFRGRGGDPQENDIEALMKGIDLDDYDDVVLVGDNSPVRDMALLDRIEKPIRVIICDPFKEYVNPEYARIAFETGGSLHTLNADIKDLEEAYVKESGVSFGGKFIFNKEHKLIRVY